MNKTAHTLRYSGKGATKSYLNFNCNNFYVAYFSAKCLDLFSPLLFVEYTQHKLDPALANCLGCVFFAATSFILPLSPDTARCLSLSLSWRFREHDECPGTITWAWPSWYFRSKHTLVGGNKCLFEYSELFYLLVLCVYRVACSFGPSMHFVD